MPNCAMGSFSLALMYSTDGLIQFSVLVCVVLLYVTYVRMSNDIMYVCIHVCMVCVCVCMCCTYVRHEQGAECVLWVEQ